jgi:carbon monoxide dehydrogenase subunit G
MQLENSLQIPAPPDRVWEFLLDLERVTPCMPGAELTEMPDERTWKGNVSVKLGAVSLSYASTVVIDQRDDANRHVVLKASGREKRGKGMATATIDSRVEPAGDRVSQVVMVTDLTISGAVAQYGRGMIADVSKRLTDQFADCLSARLAAGEAEIAPGEDGAQTAPEPVAAKPIGGIRLGLWALVRALGRALARIWSAISSLFRRG